MKIRFLREFGGRETQEIHYSEGHEMETGYPVTDSVAQDLLGRGIVTVIASDPENTPEPTRRGRKGKE